jgi:hypothetical protein
MMREEAKENILNVISLYRSFETNDSAGGSYILETSSREALLQGALILMSGMLKAHSQVTGLTEEEILNRIVSGIS